MQDVIQIKSGLRKKKGTHGGDNIHAGAKLDNVWLPRWAKTWLSFRYICATTDSTSDMLSIHINSTNME